MEWILTMSTFLDCSRKYEASDWETVDLPEQGKPHRITSGISDTKMATTARTRRQPVSADLKAVCVELF